jgi:hypothetical protein
MTPPRPSSSLAWTAIAVLAAVGLTWMMQTQALDLAYQLRAGEIMLEDGAVLRTDTFTYTVARDAWFNQQWGAQVLLALVARVGDWAGLDLLRGLGVGATVALVAASCRARGASAMVAGLLAFGGWLVAAPALVQLRPQLLGTVLFTASMWIVVTRAEHPRRLWWLPLLTLVWANAHGSFPLVFVLLALASIEDLRGARSPLRHLGPVAAACAVATAITPFGPTVWGYVVDLATDPVVAERVGEWGPPTLASAAGTLFYASLAIVGIGLVALRRSVRITDLLALTVFAVLALLAVRAAVWWALSAPVILAGVLARAGVAVEEREAARGRAWPVIVAAFGVVALIAFASARGIDDETGAPAMLSFAPERLVAVLRDELPAGANVFASQLHASWAEYSAPELRYAVDSRIELFPADIWERYFAVSAAQPDWEGFLIEDDVQGVLLDPDQAPGLLEAMATDPSWRLVASDAQGAAFVRD